jgi:hypothetical protein
VQSYKTPNLGAYNGNTEKPLNIRARRDTSVIQKGILFQQKAEYINHCYEKYFSP